MRILGRGEGWSGERHFSEPKHSLGTPDLLEHMTFRAHIYLPSVLGTKWMSSPGHEPLTVRKREVAPCGIQGSFGLFQTLLLTTAML